MEELIEGEGESSSSVRNSSSIGSGGGVRFGFGDIRSDVFNRLVENGNEDVLMNPDEFRHLLDTHFNRLPSRYGLDVNLDKVEDIVLHQKLLSLAKDPTKRPVFHVRFKENFRTESAGNDDLQVINTIPSTFKAHCNIQPDGILESNTRNCGDHIDFEPCSKLEGLNLDVRKNAEDVGKRFLAESIFEGLKVSQIPVHEIIFSTIDKPKLLSQLSSLLSDIGLNIREAHVFSTTDGYSLDVFVVDGWPAEDTDGLLDAVEKAVATSEGSCYASSPSNFKRNKLFSKQPRSGDWEIDKSLLTIGAKIASGSCGELYRGVYHGQDIAIKILRSEQLNDASEEEFSQELAILREVEHNNVVRFIGACTKDPELCIVTEYMAGGSLYDFLHKHHNIVEFPVLLKFAIDISKGMEYLHQNNIIHRDLKTANLLMDTENVVKVADFGVARFQIQGGVMTAETGTYRWMAPEVINHQAYDQKADVFSFAIVLWELITAKVPYDSMSPLQAALGVRQGLRPAIPDNAHPKLLDLMQRCWEGVPSTRPAFSEITLELEALFQEIQIEPVSIEVKKDYSLS